MDSQQWADIRRLFEVEHLTQRQIARRLGIHRYTVKRALGFTDAAPGRAAPVPRPSKLDPYKDYLARRLQEYPELSGFKLLDDIRRQGYAGGYTVLKEFVAGIRPARKEVFLRLETLPGEQAQVDWANCGNIVIGNARRKLSCFVMVLSWSRMIYLEFTLSQTLGDFLSCHVNAFKFFGGIPKKILYDNLKTVVLSRVGRDIRFHNAFLDFAGCHLFEPKPCNVRRANEKGIVENNIRYVRTSLLEGYEIIDFTSLQRDAVAWRDGISNVRIHGTTHERPVDRFVQEQALLQKLPERPYDTALSKSVQADSQAFIRLDTNRYSVPWALAYKVLILKASAHWVRIFNGQDLVAEHVRSYEKYLTFERPEHRKGLLAKRRGAHAAKLAEAFQALGEPAKQYLHGMLAAELHLPYHITKIMNLVARFGKAEVLGAIERALTFKAFGGPYIQNIIFQCRARRGAPEIPPLEVASRPEWTDITVDEHHLDIYDAFFDGANGQPNVPPDVPPAAPPEGPSA
jgi:transposase